MGSIHQLKSSIGLVALTCLLAISAKGQWTVINLHPGGNVAQSLLFGVGGGQQAGYAIVNNAFHASVWSGTAASWVDLNPLLLMAANRWALLASGARISRAYGAGQLARG